MGRLPEHKDGNGIDYVLMGDYYILMLALPEEDRPVGRWGWMRREHLRECHSGYYCGLLQCGLPPTVCV